MKGNFLIDSAWHRCRITIHWFNEAHPKKLNFYQYQLVNLQCRLCYSNSRVIMKINSFNNYFLLYFLAAAQTRSAPKIFNQKYLKWTPIIILSLTIIAYVYFHVYGNKQTFEHMAKIDILYKSFNAFTIFPNVLIVIHNIKIRDREESIPKKLLILKSDIEKEFNALFNADKFLRWHTAKVFILTGSLVISTMLRVIIPPLVIKTWAEIIRVVMYFILNAFVLYFLFHVDLLRSILQFMNANLNKLSKEKKLTDEQRVDTLNYISFLHRKLWECKNMIEKQFACILVLIIFRFVVRIIFNSYQFFDFMFTKEEHFIFAYGINIVYFTSTQRIILI